MRHLELPGLLAPPSSADIHPGQGIIQAEAGIKAAARQLECHLQARRAEWHAVYRNAAPAQAWLEGRIAFSQGPQKAVFEARKRDLDRRAKDAERRIAQADADIAALADPRSDASIYRAILARQDSALHEGSS